MVEQEVPKMPQVFSPCSSHSQRRSNASNSPEFEFWMVKNPSFPQPDLHSADELFSGGVLLPLHQVHHQSNVQNNPSPPPPTPQEQESSAGNGSTRPVSESGSAPVPELSALLSNLSASAFSSSKRWKDIFKKNDNKLASGHRPVAIARFSSSECSSHGNNDASNNNSSTEKVKEKVRKREKRSVGLGGGGNGVAAELNINIWPFRRSRSAGNGGTRPRVGSLTSRKVSSAPCSRSNSAGESNSKSTKWSKSPTRNGVHLGRSSPIWQLRRPTSTSAGKGSRKVGNGGGGGGCDSDGGGPMEGVRGGNLFNIRNLFTKKVY